MNFARMSCTNLKQESCIFKSIFDQEMEENIEQVFPEVLVLNVGGNIYTTTRFTLTKEKESMLAALFSGRYKLPVDSKGRFFIDRDGTYFKYILDYLRDETALPPSSLALKVLHEAEYYQIQGLIKSLEMFPLAFLSKLDNVRNERFQTHNWKETIVKIGQKKSIKTLSSNSCVVFISSEDHEYLMSSPSCVGKQHEIIVTKQLEKNIKYSQETFQNLHERLKNPDCVIQDMKRKNMDSFVSILETQLQNDDYNFVILKDVVTCKTMHSIYGHRKESCDFKVYYYNIEFNWDA